MSQVFPIKISSLHWNGAVYTCKENYGKSLVSIKCNNHTILLIKESLQNSYIREFLKQDKYHIYMAQLSL